MKQNWEYKKLGEVCCPKKDIKRANKCFQKEDAIRYIDISSVDNTSNTIASYSDYIFQDAPSRAQQVVETGDIVLSLVRPNLKNIAIVKDCYENMVASSGFCVLRVNEIIDKRYLFYIVTSPTYTKYLLKNVSGASYPAVTEDIVKKWEFSLPPLPVQQAIVAELDKINEVIDLKKAQLKDLDLLAQSIFYNMFGDPIENPKGWDVKKFQDLFKLKSGNGLSAKAFIPGKYPVYGGNGISGYHNDFNKDGVYVIIGRVGALCGNVRMVEGQFWLTDNAFQLFYAEDNFDIVYLSNKLKLLNLRRFANAAAQPVISNSTLKDIDIILPPLPLQQEFAKKIEAIETQKAAIKQSLAEAETLLASRMDYWFN